jgi:hypothetical protein
MGQNGGVIDTKKSGIKTMLCKESGILWVGFGNSNVERRKRRKRKERMGIEREQRNMNEKRNLNIGSKIYSKITRRKIHIFESYDRK